jgi:hypothetical protein
MRGMTGRSGPAEPVAISETVLSVIPAAVGDRVVWLPPRRHAAT